MLECEYQNHILRSIKSASISINVPEPRSRSDDADELPEGAVATAAPLEPFPADTALSMHIVGVSPGSQMQPGQPQSQKLPVVV